LRRVFGWISRAGGGAPTRSRANRRTSRLASNFFGFTNTVVAQLEEGK